MAWPRVARAQRRAAVVNASDNGVNPARSANSTVTTLRSSCVSGSAVTSATPHPDQNFALCLISASGPEVPEGSGVLLSGGSIRAYFLVTPVRRGRGCSLVRCDRWRSARREAGGGLVGGVSHARGWGRSARWRATRLWCAWWAAICYSLSPSTRCGWRCWCMPTTTAVPQSPGW